jgi:hypothetical protein
VPSVLEIVKPELTRFIIETVICSKIDVSIVIGPRCIKLTARCNVLVSGTTGIEGRIDGSG